MDLITRADILAEQLGVTVDQIHQTIEGNGLRTIGRCEDGYLVEAKVALQIKAIYRNAATQLVAEQVRTPERLRDWTGADTVEAQREIEQAHLDSHGPVRGDRP